MKTSSQHFVLASLSLALALSLLTCLCAEAQVDVWTWHNDNWRSGQNASESKLTPSNVNSMKFGQICSAGVDGQIYAQPLVLSGNLTILGKPYTDVVYVATMNDSIYLFDGTNCNQIAFASLLQSGEIAVPCGQLSPRAQVGSVKGGPRNSAAPRILSEKHKVRAIPQSGG